MAGMAFAEAGRRRACGNGIFAVSGRQPSRACANRPLWLVRAIVPAKSAAAPRRETKAGTPPGRAATISGAAEVKSSGGKSGRKSHRKGAKPAVAPTYFVAVLGDSLGQMLAQGLSEAFENRPEVAILRKAKENSGLVRDDFFDWTKATRDMLASGEKIDFAVMLIGSNDRQPLRDANGSYEPRSPEWQAAYTQRIETIAAMFRDKKIPLVWVGLPILRSERLSADALAFNEFYRAYAEKSGATYIDIWEAFADEAGQYSAFGPDINGQTVRLRAADGIHFTKAGARKLAHFVEPEIRRNLDEVQPNTAPTPNLANVPNPDDAGTPSNRTGFAWERGPAGAETGCRPYPAFDRPRSCPRRRTRHADDNRRDSE